MVPRSRKWQFGGWNSSNDPGDTATWLLSRQGAWFWGCVFSSSQWSAAFFLQPPFRSGKVPGPSFVLRLWTWLWMGCLPPFSSQEPTFSSPGSLDWQCYGMVTSALFNTLVSMHSNSGPQKSRFCFQPGYILLVLKYLLLLLCRGASI